MAYAKLHHGKDPQLQLIEADELVRSLSCLLIVLGETDAEVIRKAHLFRLGGICRRIIEATLFRAQEHQAAGGSGGAGLTCVVEYVLSKSSGIGQ